MPRPLRDDFPGALQHVFARGNRKQTIFLDHRDYRLYLALLGGVVVAKKWRVLAYCLMPNHLHLLIETPDAGLAAGMQQLHGLYARLFNDRHGHVGHLFQGRYGSKLVRDDLQLRAVARYIALNPVDAGLVEHPADWTWNSYMPTINRDGPRWLDADRLLGYAGAWAPDEVVAYSRLVTGGLPGPS
jgi:REP element-mobilizing transposase RayT